ncbi:MAG: hypothetical protein IPK50_07415 [Fibrobacterota bacterium]|nr:hypothetical protein [Fibrobacterota bacterium]QQS06721.1 MAG: hypothetical protein IPK50_07415 [Fibrobacterota bacterium]
MKRKTPFALIAASLLGLLQSCQENQTTGPGDRSREGSGAVSFRLSQGSVEYLRRETLFLQYQVWGPGMDTMRGSTVLDTAPIRLDGIPCGTRFVMVKAVDSIGVATWTGSDTVEVNPNSTSLANIVLRRTVRRGGILIEVSLDSTDTILPPARVQDTTWIYEIFPSYSKVLIRSCSGPQRVRNTDTMRTACHHFELVPYPGDTTYVHGDTHESSMDNDTSCIGGPADTGSTWGAYTCTISHFVPWSKYDTVWRDSIVHTPLYAQTNICTPSRDFAPTIYCYHGRYQSLPAGQCESIHYSYGYPMGSISYCGDSLSTLVPAAPRASGGSIR